VPAGFVRQLLDVEGVDCVVVEGDGSRHRHLKAPREGEPVIPAETSLLVPVVGIDVVGKTFTGDTVFRPEIVERISPYRRGDEITLDMVRDIFFHEEGILSRRPAGARIVPFVSFVDGPRELAHARDLAVRALRERPFGIRRILLGNADPGRVLEVLADRSGA
jgi:probable selenium-dependent hydroxylase accessory protein YqeC